MAHALETVWYRPSVLLVQIRLVCTMYTVMSMNRPVRSILRSMMGKNRVAVSMCCAVARGSQSEVVAFRVKVDPGVRGDSIGFRLARAIP